MGDTGGQRETSAGVAVALIPVVVIGGVVLGFAGVFDELVSGIGTEDPDEVNWSVVAAVALGVVGPVTGMVLAARAERPGVRTAHAVLLAITALLVLVAFLE